MVQPETFVAPSWTSNPRSGLEHLAGATGGRILQLSGRDVDVLDRVRLEMSGLYVALARVPMGSRPSTTYPLSVRSTRPGVRVVARSQFLFPGRGEFHLDSESAARRHRHPRCRHRRRDRGMAGHRARWSVDRGSMGARQLSPFQRTKVEWLLANRLPCLGCHVINGSGGRLGPDLTLVGHRLSAAAIDEKIANPQATHAVSIMPPVPMPADWRRSVALYLSERRQGLPPTNPQQRPWPAPDAAASPAPTDGPALYERYCSGCHGISGRGDGENSRYLAVAPTRHADSAVMSLRTDDWLFDVIARGGYPMNRHPSMPPYGGVLPPAAIRTLVRHVRRLCACEGPSWSRDGRAFGRPTAGNSVISATERNIRGHSALA